MTEPRISTWAEREGVTVEWEDDWSLGTTHADFYSDEAYPEGDPTTCETCIVYDPNGNVLASLGCIDDADDTYRREIVEELMAEGLAPSIRAAEWRAFRDLVRSR